MRTLAEGKLATTTFLVGAFLAGCGGLLRSETETVVVVNAGGGSAVVGDASAPDANAGMPTDATAPRGDGDAGPESAADANAPNALPDAETNELFDGGTDSGASGINGGALDAALAAPCLGGGNTMAFMGAEGFPGISGTQTISGAQATYWDSVSLPSGIQIFADPPGPVASPWQWQANGIPLVPGTYVSDGGGTAVSLKTASGACFDVLTGSFTIGQLAVDENEGIVTNLLVWFDLSCPRGGTIQGCVSYGE